MEQGITIFGFNDGLVIDLTQVATWALIALLTFCVKEGVATIEEIFKKSSDVSFSPQ